MRFYAGLAALVAAVFAFVGTLIYINDGSSSATPTHVAAVFIDGLNHGDFRQACSQIAPNVVARNWKNQAGCETYFTVDFAQYATFAGTISGYKIVPKSERGWREGNAKVASVRVSYNGGSGITLRLVKTSGGWKIVGSRATQ